MRWRLILLVILALTVLLALSVALQLDVPAPTGPYPVGRTTLRWTDSSRPEVLTDAPDDYREIVVEVWYPAQAGTRAQAPYIPDLARIAPALAASGEVAPVEVFGLRLMRPYGYLNAQLAAAQARYPLVILSPGNGTNAEFYAATAGELASHGYVVFGINHPYDVAAVALQDGRIAQFAPGPIDLQARGAWVAERVAVRTADVLFALDQLELLNESADGLFSGRLDLAHVGVMGHSLGGIAAAQACVADARLAACLNLDGIQRGGPFSTSEAAVPPAQPFMMITKEQQLHPIFIAKFAEIPAGSFRVVIAGASHDSFTDGPLLVPALLPLPNQADRILTLVRACTLAFFEQTLKGRPSGLLAQSHADQDVALEVYPAHE